MKKNLLVTAIMVCASAMAWAAPILPNAVVKHSPEKIHDVTLTQYLTNNGVAERRAALKSEGETVISEAPEGVLYDNMYAVAESYGMGWGDVYYQHVDGGLGGVCEGKDGAVYVKGLLSQAYIWGLGTPWVKCEKAENNTIVMQGHQLYAIDYGDNYYIEVLKYDEANQTFVIDPDKKSVKFEWKNGVLTWADKDENTIIGLCDATGGWFYMGDWDIKYSVCNDVVPEIPAGATKMPLKMQYNNDCDDLTSLATAMVDAYVSGTDIYIDHLNPDNSASAIKGTIGYDGKITIADKQYLGINTMYNSHIYALTANAKVEKAGTGDDAYNYFNFDKVSSITVAPNAAFTEFKAEYPASVVINAGKGDIYYIEAYIAPIMTLQEDKAMTPADPSFYQISNTNEFTTLRIVVPTVDVDGKELNTNNLFLNVILNDKPYTFTTDKYIGLTEDLTDIPYGYSDPYYDIWYSSSTGRYTIYFYELGWEKVGVQTIYTSGGETRRSNIVYIDYAAGVEGVEAAKDIESVEYFDLYGRSIEPADGNLAIKRIRYTDGTVKVEKTVVK